MQKLKIKQHGKIITIQKNNELVKLDTYINYLWKTTKT